MNFPKPKLSRDEAMQLWISEHSDYAKEQVILNNAGIVGIVLKSLNLDLFDEDLFQIGMVGLVKTVNTFDPDKGVKFTAYATPIIRNEILTILRKKRIISAFSLDETRDLGNGESVNFSEMVADKRDYEDESISMFSIKNIFSNLSNKEYQILHLYVNRGMTQNEISREIGLSQPYISRILTKIQKKLEKEFDY